MKKAVCVILLSAVVLSVVVLCAVVFAGRTSVSYHFVMKLRNVDGWNNGKSFSLPAGTASISGYMSAEPIDVTSSANPNPVNYSLCSKGFLNLFTTEHGTVRGSAWGYFSGTFGEVPKGNKYYLNAWMVVSDYWKHTGDGEITVTY